MNWYLIYSKPRQERTALENLERQGYACYLPLYSKESIRAGKQGIATEPLFPRYLFIQLGQDMGDKSWSPIRSTLGVSRLVGFGSKPLTVPESLVSHLKARQAALLNQPQTRLRQGQIVTITSGPFAGFDGLYQMQDAQQRAIVLIELLSKPASLSISPAMLCAVA